MLLIGFAYLYDILSSNHYTPSSHDFYINCVVFILCSIGLSIFFFKREIQIYISDFFWLVIFFILLVQPVFHNILDFLHKSFFNQFNCLSFTQSKLYMPASKLNRRFNLLRRFLYTQDKILKHFILPNTCST